VRVLLSIAGGGETPQYTTDDEMGPSLNSLFSSSLDAYKKGGALLFLFIFLDRPATMGFFFSKINGKPSCWKIETGKRN